MRHCPASLIRVIGLLAAASAAHAEMVHDLGAIPGALRTTEAQQVFREQMAGTPPPDGLAKALPTGLSAKAIVALLVPAGDTAPLNAVTARPWLAEPGRFVVLACTGGQVPSGPEDDPCYQSSSGPVLHAYLGVIELEPGGAPRLVAGRVTVDPTLDWKGSMLPDSPEAVEDPVPGDQRSLAPTRYDRLDLAPYRIAPDQPAFGLRASWSDGYAGGFGWHSALFLYAVVDGALRQVLGVPVLALTDFAGDWNRDGSRQHEIQEGANVVVVSNRKIDGHFDLEVRSRLTRHVRVFRWQARAAAYQPSP